MYSSDPNFPQQKGLAKAGLVIDGNFEPGMLCYGVPVGTDTYVRHMLQEKVNEVEKDIQSITVVLQSEHQALWAILRSCIAHKLDYWLTLVYPSIVKEAAEKMDCLQSHVLEKLLGLAIPLKDNGMDYECPLSVPVASLANYSFQRMVIQQPVKFGGSGIRSNAETCLPAFVGGLELALPHLVGPDGVCRSLEGIIGNGQLPSNQRWQPLLASGSRTGRELLSAWNLLQQEEQEASAYLHQTPEGPLIVDAQGAGDGASDESTRKKIVQRREELRAAVFLESARRNRNQRSRQVVSLKNRDKMSTAWLHCLPGPAGLNNVAFSEALALLLCMPSPACRERVGFKIGAHTARVDIYGDKVMSTPLPGDHWRTRHDTTKMEIASLCAYAKVEHTAEVFGLFSHLIPQEALNRYERGRKRQGIVPDFRLKTANTQGASGFQLAELKLISCCETRYTCSECGWKCTCSRQASK